MQHHVLIISNKPENYFPGSQNYIYNIYKRPTESKFIRVFRKICLSSAIFVNWWLGDWYLRCAEYDAIILFDTGNANYIIKDIRRRYPNIRIILWYWNPIQYTISLDKIDRRTCEVWSYHEDECSKYQLKHNTQFFINTNISPVHDIRQDVYFCGADKGRAKILLKLADEFKKQGITYKYVIVKSKNSVEKEDIYSKPISSEQNNRNEMESKAIIDIVDEKHFSGTTLRPFEAARNRKKIITNDKSLKHLKFYSPKNFFILGEDPISTLKEFINTPFDDALSEELEYYEINNWVERFF